MSASNERITRTICWLVYIDYDSDSENNEIDHADRDYGPDAKLEDSDDDDWDEDEDNQWLVEDGSDPFDQENEFDHEDNDEYDSAGEESNECDSDEDSDEVDDYDAAYHSDHEIRQTFYVNPGNWCNRYYGY